MNWSQKLGTYQKTTSGEEGHGGKSQYTSTMKSETA